MQGHLGAKGHYFVTFSWTAARLGTFACDFRYLCGIRNFEVDVSKSYIIEVGSRAAGIVVRSSSGYVFFAASRLFSSLEGRLFRSAREAERAAARLASAA